MNKIPEGIQPMSVEPGCIEIGNYFYATITEHFGWRPYDESSDVERNSRVTTYDIPFNKPKEAMSWASQKVNDMARKEGWITEEIYQLMKETYE